MEPRRHPHRWLPPRAEPLPYPVHRRDRPTGVAGPPRRELDGRGVAEPREGARVVAEADAQASPRSRAARPRVSIWARSSTP